jgi:hypothetical protein
MFNDLGARGAAQLFGGAMPQLRAGVHGGEWRISPRRIQQSCTEVSACSFQDQSCCSRFLPCSFYQVIGIHNTYIIIFVSSSVVDPWHFGVDPDPEIHASDKWIRIRILDLDPAIFVTSHKDASKKTGTIYIIFLR